ncbi:RNA-binding protein [Anaerobacterium chartisolvens]|uniref:RNA-binding protein n=1 Tax=Anaerobacterium chartisolvens TaxID=1297424 RepID=UPI000DF27600|nr:RNA-binding protein [Anaerobacterium chartisolvens]
MLLVIALGEVVYSKVGRDASKRFVIVQLVDESYVMIADGSLRRIERPKKKKLKHLRLTGEVLGALNEKLKNGMKVTNSDIRKALADVDGRESAING